MSYRILRDVLTKQQLQQISRDKRQRSRQRALDAIAASKPITLAALDAVAPSVKGLAARAATLKAGITMIQTARAVAAKTGDAELAALANSPKLNKALDAAIKRLGRDADSILREQNAQQNTDDPTQAALVGQDAAIRQIQRARFSTAMDVAEANGALNPSRVAAGLGDEVPDDVYAFMGDPDKSASK